MKKIDIIISLLFLWVLIALVFGFAIHDRLRIIQKDLRNLTQDVSYTKDVLDNAEEVKTVWK